MRSARLFIALVACTFIAKLAPQAVLHGFHTFAQIDIVLQVGANVVIDPSLEADQLSGRCVKPF